MVPMVPLTPTFFYMTPIEAVKVSSENIQRAAEWCGGLVQEVASRKVEGRMDPYVLVPTPKSATTSWAFPGMIITKRIVVNERGELRSTFAVFRRDYFDKNYFESLEVAVEKTWTRSEQENSEVEHIKNAMENAMAEAIERTKEKHLANDPRVFPTKNGRKVVKKMIGDPLKPFTVGETEKA